MQISIIIPIYKVEKYIERCIKSIITQTFTDYEVILIDDKSPDNTLQIAEKLLQENDIVFQSIQHQENQGLSEARNSGIKIAKGKYIMFIDSDDELAHNEVLTQFHEAIEQEQVDFVTANFKVIWNENNIKKGQAQISKKIVFQSETMLEAFLNAKIHMSAWNKLINKDFLLKNNLFFLKDLICEDELWAFQMCMVAKKAHCLPYYNYNYYKNNLNSITKGKDKKYYESNIYILKKQLEIAKEKQRINNKNANAFIFHFKRMSQKVLRPKLLENKELWIEYYKQISEIYKQSELWQYRKLFRLSAQIAYFIRKEQRRNRQNNGNRIYRKILDVLHNYNGVYPELCNRKQEYCIKSYKKSTFG